MNTDYARKLAETVLRRYPAADSYPFKSWCYPQGYLLIGLARLWKATGDIRYRDYIYGYCDSHVTPDGENIGFRGGSMDDMMPGAVLVWMYEQTGEDRYKKACRRIWNSFADYPRTKEGGFLHSSSGLDGQMWVDGVFMGQMFYLRYGKAFHEKGCFDEAKRQLFLIRRYCHTHDGLLAHAYSENRQTDWAGKGGKSPCVWSEGLGWYALILSETLDLAPCDHPVYETAKNQLLELLSVLLSLQDESGLWYQVVDRPDHPDNWCDVSGSAMFTYAYYRALKAGITGGSAYERAAEKGWKGVISRMRENADGLMDVYGACDGLCVQKSYDAYVHYPQKVNAKEAVCSCLWAAVEAEWGRME